MLGEGTRLRISLYQLVKDDVFLVSKFGVDGGEVEETTAGRRLLDESGGEECSREREALVAAGAEEDTTIEVEAVVPAIELEEDESHAHIAGTVTVRTCARVGTSSRFVSSSFRINQAYCCWKSLGNVFCTSKHTIECVGKKRRRQFV